MALGTENIYDPIISLAIHAEHNFIELGRLLRTLNESYPKLFREAYTEAGLGKRKAYYFVAIVKQFKGLPISNAELASIGWTRAGIIGKHVTPKNVSELFALAEQHSTRDLNIIMSGGQPVSGTRTVVLHLKPRQYQRFVKALTLHGGKLKGKGIKNKERALMNLIDAAGVEETAK